MFLWLILDTISTGPHQDPLFEEEGFIGFRPSHPEPVLEIPFNDVTPPIKEAFRRFDGRPTCWCSLAQQVGLRWKQQI